ncbi:MAG: PDC sensor domain-containing protein, partial [Deltaproteobacteria bacterium]|nr:PDC sensor domain-containing protein [Deltaproteobacteria bacterium]
MPIQRQKQDDVVGFHGRHALYMLMVYAVLLAALFLLLAKQYSLNAEHEDRSLMRGFQEHVSELDNLLATVTTRVEGMRILTESDIQEIDLTGGGAPPLSFRYLKEAEGGGRFHLDEYGAPFTREQIGNLTGRGSLANRDPEFYNEIYMALRLNPRFHAISMAIKDAAWIYYTSARGFINIYPWVSSREFKFSEELFTHGFFTLGTPERNPDRRLFWTEVYVDEYGKGLMTTCAAPVYDRNRFLGTVAIDLTVDSLNAKVKRFQSDRGTMILVNDRDQLLAHPLLVTSHDRHTRTLKEALPEKLRPLQADVTQVPDNGSLHLAGYAVLRSELHCAPWTAYYVGIKPSPWGSFLNR